MTATAHGLHSLVGMWGRHLLYGLLAGAMLVATASTRAAAGDVDAPASGPLRQEWVGIELTPVSYATSDPPYSGDGSFSTWQAGPGATLRLGRYRGEHWYVIPFMLGLYVSNDGKTIFPHTAAEGGLIVPGTARRLELGVGLGIGVLSMEYSTNCDGRCVIGGSGPFGLLAARVLIWNARTFTAGVAIRAFVPLAGAGGEPFGSSHGESGLVMGALEVGFGRP